MIAVSIVGCTTHLVCEIWICEGRMMEVNMGCVLNAINVVVVMMESENKWRCVSKCIREIMSAKEK